MNPCVHTPGVTSIHGRPSNLPTSTVEPPPHRRRQPRRHHYRVVRPLPHVHLLGGGTVGDIKFDWTVPTGTVLRWSDQTGVSGLHSTVDVYSAPGGTTQVAFQIWATVVTSSTAGNVTFLWAQNALDATATIVRANSMLQLTRAA